MECSDEGAPDGWAPHIPTCWLREDLPDKLDEGNLDDYTHDLNNYGPHKPYDGWTKYHAKWNARRVTPSKLIQLAFHDCLRYWQAYFCIIVKRLDTSSLQSKKQFGIH